SSAPVPTSSLLSRTRNYSQCWLQHSARGHSPRSSDRSNGLLTAWQAGCGALTILAPAQSGPYVSQIGVLTMPPLPNVANVLKVELLQSLDAVSVVNLFYFSYTGGPPTDANLDTFAASVSAEWHTDVMALQSVDLQLTEVIVTDLTTTSSSRGTDATLRTGASGSAILSSGAAFVIRKNIARRYRGGHPRMYLCGLLQSQLNSPRTFTNAAATAFIGAVNTWVTNLVGIGCPGTLTITPVSVSYHTGHALRPVPVVDGIISIGGDKNVGSQRRRNGR